MGPKAEKKPADTKKEEPKKVEAPAKKVEAAPAAKKVEAAAPAKKDAPAKTGPWKKPRKVKAAVAPVAKPARKQSSKHNPLLKAGVRRYSKAQMVHRRAAWLMKNKTTTPPTKRVIHKCPRFYPADIKPRPLPGVHVNKPQKLRASITPGTVLIVLAGRYRGRRVVFLKQLKSGALLVTGPYKVNGVPLRRINQAYVIATSTKIGDISGVDLSGIEDSIWVKKQSKKHHNKLRIASFFPANKSKRREEKAEFLKTFKDLQKKVDAGLLPLIKQTPLLREYMESHFALSNGQYPHAIKF